MIPVGFSPSCVCFSGVHLLGWQDGPIPRCQKRKRRAVNVGRWIRFEKDVRQPWLWCVFMPEATGNAAWQAALSIGGARRIFNAHCLVDPCSREVRGEAQGMHQQGRLMGGREKDQG